MTQTQTKTNLDYLNEDLKYLGFGEKSMLNQHLEAQILREPASFELFTEAFFDSDTKLEAKLYFIKSETNSKYYLNKYDALLRYSAEPEKDRGQTFLVFKGQGVTYKEAFNLLQGRAVYKTLTSRSGIPYQSWIQLDFGRKDANGNFARVYYRGKKFELEESLRDMHVREMTFDNLRETVIRSLQRGNLHPVNIDAPDRQGKYLIGANPACSAIDIYPLATRAADIVES
jgi:hypothetical protein